MFMELDLEENKDKLTQIITGIGQNIASKVEKGEELDEHQKLYLLLIE
jgi:mannose-6-phosphate isomerase